MATLVPPLNVPQSKLEKLADDLAKLSVNTTVQVAEGAAPVPAFQRQGYLHKLGHSRQKWFHRFFVLRDSVMLSYNLQKSDFTVEPRSAIHLGNCTIQTMTHNGKDFCFLVTTMQKDRFLFAADSEEERQAWVRDLNDAKSVTHANMIKLAVENQCLAEEKGAAGIASEVSVSALSLFSNQEYIQNTPITGGAEGWLRTLGFNPEEKDKKSKKLQKCYFILRDSHLMMFQGGDILTKPRGAMYLLGTVVTASDEGGDGEFHFSVRSLECGDEIALVATTHKVRARWTTALRVGARVSYPDYKLLLKEHELLSKVTMTPRAAPPPKANVPATALTLAPPPLLAEDIDIQGEQLDPGTNQPYDESGNALLRNPMGKLVNSDTGEMVAPNTARFNANGQQLDPFNRPLPPGAVPMFTISGQAIGVGPDGNHYLPSGETIAPTEKHFDADGNELDQSTVDAASAVATDIGVAIKVRNKLKGAGTQEEAVDVLGRTFRDSKDTRSNNNGMLVNRDGDEVPLASARKIQSSSGQLVDYKPEEETGSQTSVLTIKIDNEGEEKELGQVEIDSSTTLREVRNLITSEIRTNLEDFVFLWNQVPLLKYEEMDKLAYTLEDNEVVIRGKELKKVAAGSTFSRKVGETMEKQTKVQQEQNEFNDIMNRVRQGKFLRNTKNHLLD